MLFLTPCLCSVFMARTRQGERSHPCTADSLFVFLPLLLCVSVIPRTSRRLSIGVFSPFILCNLVASGSPSLPLLAILPLSASPSPGNIMVPPPAWSPSSRCEEIQLQPPEIWSPDPCQPHSHDFLTDAIVRKMSRMFCQAARGREVTCATFLCLYLHRPEIRF